MPGQNELLRDHRSRLYGLQFALCNFQFAIYIPLIQLTILLLLTLTQVQVGSELPTPLLFFIPWSLSAVAGTLIRHSPGVFAELFGPFLRRSEAAGVAQVADLVGFRAAVLNNRGAGTQAQAFQRVVELFFGRFAARTFFLGSLAELPPAIDEPLRLLAGPAQSLQ